ncbi:MAG: caspase family protein [Clostridiaceae bacterium]|nr:caspase family protein [Clostridiaceae bacterium]
MTSIKNYAIVIGVSDYLNAENLPACANDVEIIEQLLRATEKYDILKINESIKKSALIEQIEEFLSNIRADDSVEIGEIFFYFSGHGHQDSEAHFCLHDTTLEKLNSTSLNNSEIDSIVRRCNPKLYIKVIDACQSGLSYIKSIPLEDERLDIVSSQIEAKKNLENCIFMCSSKKNQSSLATKEYSLFTQSFVEAIINASTDSTIRYTDIQNYITDVFNSRDTEQTPYFVMQADGRDIFTEQTPEIKKLIDTFKRLPFTAVSDNAHIDGNIKVQEFLRRYRSKDEVKAIFDTIKDIFASFVLADTWLTQYYAFTFEPYGNRHDDETSIVKFLYNKRNSENLYVEVETNEGSKRNFFGIESLITYPISFTSKVSELPTFCSFMLKPNQDGLPQYEISFVFIYSDTYFYAFTAAKEYVIKGWSDNVEGKTMSYTYKKVSYQDFNEEEWKVFIEKQIEKGIKFAEKSLECFAEQI